MALEGLIAELIASLDKNTAALKDNTKASLVSGIKTVALDAENLTAEAVALATKIQNVVKVKEEKPEPDLEEVKELEYKDVRDPIFAVSKKSREEAEALLKTFGVAKITQLTQDQWPEAIAKANAFLSGAVSFVGEASKELE